MKKRLIPYTLFSSALAAFLYPLAALAVTYGANGNASGQTFASLVRDKIFPIINAAIPLLATVAVIIFFWGVIRFIASSGGAKEHVEGRELLLWGTIALFVLFSIWGIIGILKATFFS